MRILPVPLADQGHERVQIALFDDLRGLCLRCFENPAHPFAVNAKLERDLPLRKLLDIAKV